MMNKKRSCEGSISLFLVIVMVAILTLQSVFIQSAKLRDLELRAGRAINLASDVMLASYDDDLAENYGLLAFQEASLPGDVEDYIASELSALPAVYRLEIQERDRFAENISFQEQVSGYMKIIYPQIMLERILDETNLLQSFYENAETKAGEGESAPDEGSYSNTSLKSQIETLLHSTATDIAINQFKHFLQEHTQSKPNNILRNFFKSESDEHEGDEGYEAPLDDEELTEGDSFLNNLGLSDSEISWSPTDILVMVSEGIDMLNFETNDLYDRLLTIEYTLNMTTNWQDQRRASKTLLSRENLRGQGLGDMYHYRELETEFVLTGFDEVMAKTTASTLINSTRLAIRVISLLQNEAQMQKLSALARILSVGIAVLSGGSVVIEAESLKYVLAFIRAQIDAAIDVNDLLNGEKVSLLPYGEHSDIKSEYTDYLRIFFLVGNKKRQLERLAETIELNISGPLYTGFDVSLQFESQHRFYNDFSLSKYASYVESGDTVGGGSE